jgi:hypothetical protein
MRNRQDITVFSDIPLFAESALDGSGHPLLILPYFIFIQGKIREHSERGAARLPWEHEEIGDNGRDDSRETIALSIVYYNFFMINF